jgi:hypothetical protein
MMLDIARGLALSPEETTACLIRDVNEPLEEGDVIAQYETALPRLFRAPVEGKIINYHQGMMALATAEIKISVSANMIATVEEVLPEYGARLSSQGSLLQGMWGNRLSGSGVLKVIESSLEEPVDISGIEEVDSGQILAVGRCLEDDLLNECQKKEIGGLIVCVLSSELISKVQALPFPVIVLQGFGELIPAQDLFELLASNSGLVVSLNACQSDYFKGERPEIIIPKEEGTFERQLGFRKNLEIGDQVRLLSGKAISQVGKVVELFEEETSFNSGISAPTALVKIKSLEKIRIPQQNLLVVN